MKYAKKTLALLLALAMLFSMAPASFTASAEETTPKLTFTEPTAEETEETAAPAEAVTVPEEAPETTQPDAADTQIPTVSEKIAMEPWVNPLYADVLDADDLKPHVPQAQPDASVQASYVNEYYAGTHLRSKLKSRTEEITLYVIADASNYKVVLSAVLEIALAHTGNAREGDYLNYNIAGMDGSYSRNYVNNQYRYDFELTFTYMTTASQETQVTNAVSSLITSLGIRYKSDYAQISAVYDYMCQNITYDYAHMEDPSYLTQFSAYGAIIDKTAVCQGYALLFYRIMLELKVDCRIIAGIAGDEENNGPHAWNIVELNGLYYNMDTTWDAGYDEYIWFMNNSGNFIYHYRDMSYDTIAFHRAHPMAAEDYDPDTKAEKEPYIYWGVCGDEAIWTIDHDGCVTVAGSGEMYDYPLNGSKEDLAPWRYWEDEITAVVVEEGITEIGDNTFCCEDSLTDVTLPDTLEKIGGFAFASCPSLEQITIPESVTAIGGFAFTETGLTSIVIPDSVTSFSVHFNECHNLKTVVLGTGITQLAASSFISCSSLTNITFRGEITYIPMQAFANCSSLKSFTVPETVTSIGESAFSNCSSLTSFTIPASVSTVEHSAFRNCEKLTEVIFEGSPRLNGRIFRGNNDSLNTSIKTLRFLGAVPEFASNSFSGVTATAYYPAGVTGWTEDVLQDYGGNITWVASEHKHNYEAIVTPPTCTEQGYTTYSCTLCVESYVADYTDPTGHTPGEVHVENEVPATCTEKGSCDNVTLCAVCGEECGRETVIVDEIPHTPGEVHVENEIPATCTEKGSYDNVTYCTVCNVETSRETVETDMIPHTYSDTVTDPTCEEQGFTTHTCTVCGDTYADSYTDALGHIYVDYTVTGKPTRNSTGELTGTCTRCGGITTVVLPALNEEDYTCEVILEPTDDEHGSAIYTWNVTDYGTVVIEVRLRKLSGLPLGDLNDDGEVDIFDANLIVAWYNGTADLDEDQQEAADVNGDGEADIFDANLVVAYYNGTITEFPET